MVASISSAEDLIWRAYTRQIFSKLVGSTSGGDIGSNGAIFACPLTTQGIAAGDWINPSVTNNQLYRVADSLMPRDTPIYLPGSGSYFETLQTYLSWVQLDGDPTQAAKDRVKSASQDLDNANKSYNDARKEAYLNFKTDIDNNLNFDVWCSKYAPGVSAKFDAMQGAAGALAEVQQEVYGHGTSTLNQYRNALQDALSTRAAPGLNMPCITEDISNIQNYLSSATSGETPSFSTDGTFYRPNYSLQNYSALVKDWVVCAHILSGVTISFSISDGISTPWSDLGFEHIDLKTHGPRCSFLRASAGYGSADTTEHLSLDETTSSLECTITFKGLKAVSLNTGTWDVPNFRSMYPNLMPGAPPELIPSLVKAERLLVGYAPGMTVKFDANTYNQAHSLITTASKAGGRVSFFGFDIGVNTSGNVQRTQTTGFDSVRYDSQSYTISIPPVFDSYPVLVGVLARKL